jgi:hypothetical protein
MTNKINEMLPTDNQNTSTQTSGTQNGATVNIKKKDIATDPNLVKNLSKSGKVNINVIEEDGSPESIIEPQDDATIKYLSNVKDAKTGEVSPPFSIDGKKYQMVRGRMPSKEITMAVFCHDELNEQGENVIHPIDIFEKNIVQPMMEKEAMMQKEAMLGNDLELGETQKPKLETKKVNFNGGDESLNLSQSKHYLVNGKTGKFRRFKTIQELASATMTEEEKYMNLKEFKRYFENKVFGGKKDSDTSLLEVELTGEEDDATMNAKAKKLIQMISKKIPAVIISTIKTPVAKREVIAAFAELIGVPRQGLPNLIGGLKDLAKQPVDGTAPVAPAITERKILTKSEIMETINKTQK